ncbi:hypothetical protein [Nakamurella panacisegetis]|uniref:hypothetical protein n=1 Tax=Nakamurella panacisegetis TaxID=1090615 RepID=UPI0012FE4267|nr:hypothetical protein [Nakamurella panacisegetis]
MEPNEFWPFPPVSLSAAQRWCTYHPDVGAGVDTVGDHLVFYLKPLRSGKHHGDVERLFPGSAVIEVRFGLADMQRTRAQLARDALRWSRVGSKLRWDDLGIAVEGWTFLEPSAGRVVVPGVPASIVDEVNTLLAERYGRDVVCARTTGGPTPWGHRSS